MRQNRQKESNELAILFIILVIVHVLSSLAVKLLASKGIVIPTAVRLIISELGILLTGLIYILIKKKDLREDLGFKKIKVGTIFLAILLAVTVSPVVSFVNILTQFFVSNTMTQMSSQLLEGSSLLILFISGIYGPFCEELLFRGIFNNSYARITRPLRAGLISALFFGLMHLNVNQTCYAFVLGLIFSIVNEASGSIWTSMIMHVTVNVSNMLMLMAASSSSNAAGEDFAEAAEAARTGGDLYMTAAVYLVLALIFGAISVPITVAVSRNEGRYDSLRAMFMKKTEAEGRKPSDESGNPLIQDGAAEEKTAEENSEEHAEFGEEVRIFTSIPAVIAIILCIAIIFGLEPLMNLIGG